MSTGFVEDRNILFSDHYGKGKGPSYKTSRGPKRLDIEGSKTKTKHGLKYGTGERERSLWNTGLKKVKRKLAFTDEEEDIDRGEKNKWNLDFTDKIAAFRSILKPMKEESRLFEKKIVEKKTFTRDTALYSASKERIPGSESSSSTSYSGNSDLDLQGLQKSKDPKKLLSRLADEELARQSYINYEANTFMWMKLKQNLRSDKNGPKKSESELSEALQSNRNMKSSKDGAKNSKTSEKIREEDSDYLSKYDSLTGYGKSNLRDRKVDKDTVEGKREKSFSRTKNVKSEKNIVQNNIEYKQNNENSKTQNERDDNLHKEINFQSKFETDLDSIPQKEISDIYKLICDTEMMCQNHHDELTHDEKTRSLPRKPPLNDMLNNEGQGHSGNASSKQSNVPHFESMTPPHRQFSHRKDDVLKMQIDGLWNKLSRETQYEDFQTRNAIMNDSYLSPNKEIKQTNVEHYIESPRLDPSNKKRSSNNQLSQNLKEMAPSPKSKKARSRSDEYKTNKRNYSKSPDRKRRHKHRNNELIDDLNLSDSSKENIPRSKNRMTDCDMVDNDVLTLEDLSSSQSERNRRDRLQSRTKNKELNKRETDNLQFIPEKDTTNNPKMKKLDLPGYTVHNGGHLSDLESRQSEESTSIDGSGKSSGSQSSTVRAVELLRRLYKADSHTREDLILKARCFRRWLKNVKKLRYKCADNDEDNWYLFRALRGNIKGSRESIHSPVTKQDLDTDGSQKDILNFEIETQHKLGSERNSEIDSVQKNREPLSRQTYGIKTNNKDLIDFVNNLEDSTPYVNEDLMIKKRETTSERVQSSEHLDNPMRRNGVLDHAPRTRETITYRELTSKNTDHVTRENEAILDQGQSLGKPQSGIEKLQHGTRTPENFEFQAEIEMTSIANLNCPLMNEHRIKGGSAKGLFLSTKVGNRLGSGKLGGENQSSAASIDNIALTETAQLLDSVSYGMCLQRSEVFYRHLFLRKYFIMWKQTTVTKLRYKAALDMERKHLLRKAMKGFKWSINRSRIQVDIFQSRMKSIILTANFVKWKNSAMENRQRRLRVAFSRWQEYTVESQKIRRMRQLADKRLLVRALQQWKIRFSMRLKENAADFHYRKKLLSLQLEYWQIFTQQSKEKCDRNKLAIEFRKERLQTVMFTEMVVVYKKHRLAKQHYRIVELRQVFVAWLKSAHVCKVERQRDMSISKEHWRMSTVKNYFVQWHEQLLTQRASKSANRKLLKNSFLIWRTRWQENLQYRLTVEAEFRQQILRATIRLWFDNVCLLKQRREVAVVYIQRVLVRHVLHGWNSYTRYRKELRLIHKDFVHKQNLKMQEKFWKTWRSKFEDRLDIQKAQKFWSDACVRKAVDRWKKICHKRSLEHLLLATEPDRQLNLQKVMFHRWLVAKQNIEAEKQEAYQTRKILEHSQLLRRFKTWRAATQQQLTIKPTLIRKERQIVTKVFDAWQNLVKHKAHCRKSKELYHKSQLSKFFTSWRQQYKLHQIEKEVKKKTLSNQLRHCVDGWRFVIKRKHEATNFCQKNLVRNMFVYWRDKAFSQLHEKIEAKEILEWNTSLLKYYFELWSTNVQQQIAEREEAILLMEQQRSLNKMRFSLNSWRRHFRATLVAREYKKIHSRKLLHQLFQRWSEVTRYGVKEAVHKFAVRLGLPSPHQDEFSVSPGSESGGIVDQLQVLPEFEDFDGEADDDSGHLSPYYSSSALGTPIKRLFSPTLSRVSADLDRSLQEVDFHPSLSNTNFLDARFAMEQAVKTERLKEIVFIVIKRIRFWPISIMFDQWKEYTAQQRELKLLSSQVTTMYKQMEMKMVFRQWKDHYSDSIKAKIHWDMLRKRKIFTFLYEYKCERKWKNQLSALARKQHALTVYKKIFPMWFDKAQDKRQQERIVHLWTNVTIEEQRLIPKEQIIMERLHKKTLKICFAVWNLKFQQINKLRMAYHRIIQQKYVAAWKTWAHNKGEQRRKSNKFRETHLKSLVFKTWCLRREQKIQVEEKHKLSLQRYLLEIVNTWHRWAAATRHRRLLSKELVKTVNTHTVQSTFVTWRLLTIKQQQVISWHNNRLMHRIVEEWHSITVYKKQLCRKVLDFQVKTYTKHTIRMFRVWHQRYVERLKEHEEYSKLLERNALKIGRKWHKLAQKSRGKQLQQVFLHRQLQICFEKWKHGYERNMEREDQLQRYLTRKNWQTMGECVDVWRTTLIGNQAKRLYNLKFKATIFTEWHHCAAVSRQRELICQTLRKALQYRNMKSYILYWHNLTMVRQSIQKHYNLKLQFRVLQAWHIRVKKQRQLRTLQVVMTKRVHLRILQDTWYTLRGQFDYFQSLTDLAEKVVQEKNHVCMRKALSTWRERLNRVIAGHCYQHLLALRAIRKWRRFVYRKKQERKREQEMLKKATKHYNRILCKKVITAWIDEVHVSHQILRHKARLSNKYGTLWKLRVDMMYTAKCVEKETLIKKLWRRWRLEYVKQKTTTVVSDFNEKLLLSKVFLAWKNLYLKKPQRRISAIPIPIQSSQNTPGNQQQRDQINMTQIPGPTYNNVRTASMTNIAPSRLKERRPSLPGKKY